jgi:hypothetical protein
MRMKDSLLETAGTLALLDKRVEIEIVLKKQYPDSRV